MSIILPVRINYIVTDAINYNCKLIVFSFYLPMHYYCYYYYINKWVELEYKSIMACEPVF